MAYDQDTWSEVNRFDAVVNFRNALAVFLKDAHCSNQTPGRAKITESNPVVHDSARPILLTRPTA
ncbi:MAG: hypothetical protein V3U10_05675 [Bacteroidota bacterium]